jgi:uncharacterized membrane protein AbrB (regulator of aidB expression)
LSRATSLVEALVDTAQKVALLTCHKHPTNGSVYVVKPKTRKLLITGVALFIFGPALGWGLTFLGYFRAMQSLIGTLPGTMPDMGHTAFEMLMSMVPIVLGGICGAAGLFLILFALIAHFLGPKDGEKPGH